MFKKGKGIKAVKKEAMKGMRKEGKFASFNNPKKKPQPRDMQKEFKEAMKK